MKRLLNRTIIVVLAIILTFHSIPSKSSYVTGFEKQYCVATIDDAFTDNEILIVVMPYANFVEYSINDFLDVNCILLEELSKEIIENSLCRILKLTLSGHSKQSVLDAIYILEQRDDIYSAEPNYIFTPDFLSTDPYYVSDDQWALDAIQVHEAWNVTYQYPTVRVGIIDSGIDSNHPDLAGVVNTSLSKCFTSNDKTALEDSVGHGTHVAGIIGAAWNSIGIAGVCMNIELISLRVDDYAGDWQIADIMEAIYYAEQDDVQIPILNCSGGSALSSLAVINAFRTCIDNYDGLFVCSAGNDGRNNNIYSHYPSGYNSLNNVISVGAINENYTRYEYSNYGKTTVDVFAPGENILSTFPTNLCVEHNYLTEGHFDVGYHHLSGTSMATPFVTGVAALMLSVNPNLETNPTIVKDIIIKSVDITNGFDDLCYSGGVINAYKSVNTALMIRYNYDTTYEPLSSNSALVSKCHNVKYDICSECSCSNGDYYCDECDVCDTNCSGCHILYTELHSWFTVACDANTHSLMCDDCRYACVEEHDLYVLSVGNDAITIGCKYCIYSFECDTPEYISNDMTSHTISCNECQYSMEEEHYYEYEYLDDLEHTVICNYCINAYKEYHIWINENGSIICRDCRSN